MKTINIIISMAVILFMVSTSGVEAQQFDNEYSRLSLKGISEISVVIEDIAPDLQEDGLSVKELRTAIELKLRVAGIKVTTKEEADTTFGVGVLQLSVGSHKNRELSVYSLYLQLGLMQVVSLSRDMDIIVPAYTWQVSYLGLIGQMRIRGILDAVKNATDQFINALLAVNPK